MRDIRGALPSGLLSGAWCDNNPFATSLLEALSFATPALESFFIRTIVDILPELKEHDRIEQCRRFIQEESIHSREHRKFNTALVEYLGTHPLGLYALQGGLKIARHRLSLRSRLQLVAAMEHCSTVLSLAYLDSQESWDIGSEYARALFAGHAAEEVAHRSVAFEIWQERSHTNVLGRFSTMCVILLAATVYLGAVTLWIRRRKSSNAMAAVSSTLKLNSTALDRIKTGCALLRQLFLFVNPNHNPIHLVSR